MENIQKHRGFLIFEGILFIILGMIALALPQVSTVSVELIVGWLFLIGGIIQCFRCWKLESPAYRWAGFISALISIALGIAMLFYPIIGVLSLTLAIAIYFVVDGISRIVLGVKLSHMPNHWWLIVSGILSLIIAALVFFSWPISAFWFIGTLVGINLIFFGASLLAIATNLPKDVPPSAPK